MRSNLLIVVWLLVLWGCQNETSHEYEVVVIGGGTGGTAAGLAAAETGANTLIVEPGPWLGGMLTSAGVSAIDGNHAMPAGLWGVFRQQLRAHYGGAEALATGWVSFTQFEPHVGAAILADLVQEQQRLDVWHQAIWQRLERTETGWIVWIRKDGGIRKVACTILIDGTDLGDVAAAAGCTFDVGMESRQLTGEAMAPVEANDIIQDLTYCAILKDYSPERAPVVPASGTYDPSLFACVCKEACLDTSTDIIDCQTMLNYARLPGSKYLINWPNKGNDYYLNLISLDEEERTVALQAAKDHTLNFVHYIQQELGFTHLGLADDEFATNDLLPYQPYHREGRRIHGVVRMTVEHMQSPWSTMLPRTGIAVGDYPIDHHHNARPDAPEIDFPKVPSFNVPLGCLIPEQTDGLLVADKAISVSNIVNGSSRLQPVILQVGEAAGTLAALAVHEQIAPREVAVRTVQRKLLERRGYLMPYYDVPPDHPLFQVIQRVGATGLIQGVGEPYQWANRTWFYPDSIVTGEDLSLLSSYFPDFEADVSPESNMTYDMGLQVLWSIQVADESSELTDMEAMLRQVSADHQISFALEAPLTRAVWALWLDKVFHVFDRQVDLHGKLISG